MGEPGWTKPADKKQWDDGMSKLASGLFNTYAEFSLNSDEKQLFVKFKQPKGGQVQYLVQKDDSNVVLDGVKGVHNYFKDLRAQSLLLASKFVIGKSPCKPAKTPSKQSQQRNKAKQLKHAGAAAETSPAGAHASNGGRAAPNAPGVRNSSPAPVTGAGSGLSTPTRQQLVHTFELQHSGLFSSSLKQMQQSSPPDRQHAAAATVDTSPGSRSPCEAAAAAAAAAAAGSAACKPAASKPPATPPAPAKTQAGQQQQMPGQLQNLSPAAASVHAPVLKPSTATAASAKPPLPAAANAAQLSAPADGFIGTRAFGAEQGRSPSPGEEIAAAGTAAGDDRVVARVAPAKAAGGVGYDAAVAAAAAGSMKSGKNVGSVVQDLLAPLAAEGSPAAAAAAAASTATGSMPWPAASIGAPAAARSAAGTFSQVSGSSLQQDGQQLRSRTASSKKQLLGVSNNAAVGPSGVAGGTVLDSRSTAEAQAQTALLSVSQVPPAAQDQHRDSIAGVSCRVGDTMRDARLPAGLPAGQTAAAAADGRAASIPAASEPSTGVPSATMQQQMAGKQHKPASTAASLRSLHTGMVRHRTATAANAKSPLAVAAGAAKLSGAEAAAAGGIIVSRAVGDKRGRSASPVDETAAAAGTAAGDDQVAAGGAAAEAAGGVGYDAATAAAAAAGSLKTGKILSGIEQDLLAPLAAAGSPAAAAAAAASTAAGSFPWSAAANGAPAAAGSAANTLPQMSGSSLQQDGRTAPSKKQRLGVSSSAAADLSKTLPAAVQQHNHSIGGLPCAVGDTLQDAGLPAGATAAIAAAAEGSAGTASIPAARAPLPGASAAAISGLEQEQQQRQEPSHKPGTAAVLAAVKAAVDERMANMAAADGGDDDEEAAAAFRASAGNMLLSAAPAAAGSAACRTSHVPDSSLQQDDEQLLNSITQGQSASPMTGTEAAVAATRKAAPGKQLAACRQQPAAAATTGGKATVIDSRAKAKGMVGRLLAPAKTAGASLAASASAAPAAAAVGAAAVATAPAAAAAAAAAAPAAAPAAVAVGGNFMMTTSQVLLRQAAARLCTGLWPVKSWVVTAGRTATPGARVYFAAGPERPGERVPKLLEKARLSGIQWSFVSMDTMLSSVQADTGMTAQVGVFVDQPVPIVMQLPRPAKLVQHMLDNNLYVRVVCEGVRGSLYFAPMLQQKGRTVDLTTLSSAQRAQLVQEVCDEEVCDKEVCDKEVYSFGMQIFRKQQESSTPAEDGTDEVNTALQSKAKVGLDCGGRSDNAQPVQQQQQQQQPVISDHVEQLLHMLTNNTAAGAAAAAAAAAANLGSLQQPRDQQGPAPQPAGFQVPHQQQQQQQVQEPSLVQQVLEGGQSQWPLMATLGGVLGVLRRQGFSGLMVVLDKGCFAKTYARAGNKTRDFVAAVRARGVTVFDPEGPAQLPAPGTVHVVVVTKGQMDRSGFDNHFTQTRLADYLASGAIVVNEGFLEALLDLPKSASKLCAKLGQPGMADNQTGDFFSTGVVLLLDISLLLAADPSSIRALLKLLQSLKQLMPAEARVQAYTTKEYLRAAAACHLGNELQHDAFLQLLTGDENPELCGLLEEVAAADHVSCMSSQVEPAGTRMLRNAKKVAMICNRPSQRELDGYAPLRFVMVVTASPDAARLTDEQRQAVHAVLNNRDAAHKAVIGANLAQACRFLEAMKMELSTAQAKGGGVI